jgi:transcriptional regulator with XRE-family HTH domain
MKTAVNAVELGAWIRSERATLGRTQSWLATRVGTRRQTIADLEAGRNVAVGILFGVLTALGKGLQIVDTRIEHDRLKEAFPHED